MNKAAKNNVLKAILLGLICFVIFALIFINYSDAFSENNPLGQSDDSQSDDFVEFIDVGQGDSILICSNGYSALIDTGVTDSANNICEVISSYNIKTLDVLLLTHLDSDHVGGVDKITEIYKPQNLILPELSIESEGLGIAQLAISRVTDEGGKIYTAVQGMDFSIGDFKITVLAQLTDMASENNRSIITMAETDGKKFLLTGDLEAKGERVLLKEGLNLKCDVLKVGHHGSNSSTSDELLKSAKPQYAVISVGENNRYGHPHSKVLSALGDYGARIYRTDIDGNIVFYVNDGKITVKTSK